ncbi:hypothetical protein Scep_029626 [Stephania cephalantha]|uniref:glutathione gamma-glutamylcysteinyltransferase n=1 Tax=Stephania cephalantha TaxID=152367 RepID=A0AAP0DY17_9MAGN
MRPFKKARISTLSRRRHIIQCEETRNGESTCTQPKLVRVMAMAGLYRRILPSPPAIEFASSDGKQLFSEALQNGTMEGFFKLISYFQTQSEPAYCGLASLSMVLNALAIDPGRKWKGPWRWFDESMLDCCEPLEKVKAKGITFGKVACLAHCAGAKVEAFRTNQSNVDDFRKCIMASTSSEDCHLIASYHRAAFKQVHAYLKASEITIPALYFAYVEEICVWFSGGVGFENPNEYDSSPAQQVSPKPITVSNLRVYRYRGDPLVPLFKEFIRIFPAYATNNVENAPETSLKLHLSSQNGLVIMRLLNYLGVMQSCKHESWVSTAKYLMDDVPSLLKSDGVDDVQKVLSIVFTSLPDNFGEFIKWVAEVRRKEDGTNLSEEEKGRLLVKEEVLKEVRETSLFKHVVEWFSSMCCIHSLAGKDNLAEIAAHVCCQGAELLIRKSDSSNQFGCAATCVKCLKDNGDMPVTVVSGTVTTGKSEEGVDMLVPLSQIKHRNCTDTGANCCTMMHPASSDVLTVLLLTLPPSTWTGIKEEKPLQEIHSLVTFKNLPSMLQEEVLHLRKQLLFLKRCQDKKEDDDLDIPPEL